MHRGIITAPFIAVTGDLMELNELFNLYWWRIIPLEQTRSIAFPFSRLDLEPFWHLVPQPGRAGCHQKIDVIGVCEYAHRR